MALKERLSALCCDWKAKAIAALGPSWQKLRLPIGHIAASKDYPTIMRTVLALLISLPLGICSALSAPDPTPSSIIHTLTPEEFTKAGLNKLTPEELTFLEEVLARHQQDVAQATPVKPTEKIVQSTDRSAAAFGAEQVIPVQRVVTQQELHAHIEGTVEGFSGRAVFVLDNGQIWQQRIPDTVFLTPKLVNPEVIITRGFVGYKMLIVKANRIVFVKRIQ